MRDYVGTTNGDDMIDMSIIDGVPHVNLEGFEKPDSPAC